LGVGVFFIGLVSFFMHKEEHLNMQQKLRDRLNHDSFTGLLNKTYFLETLDNLVAQANHTNAKIGVFFVNLDRFRMVNNKFGYEVGDFLLYEVGQRLCKLVDKNQIARIEGDKFCFAIVSKEEEYLIKIANSVSPCLQNMQTPQKVSVSLTASVGIACFPMDGLDGQTLFRRAELTMYHSKEEKYGGVSFFEMSIEQEAEKKVSLENELRQALKNNGLTVYYQPKVDIEKKDVVGCEALVRWQKKDGRWVPPQNFVPLAEETGLVSLIDMYVLRSACREHKKWEKKGFENVRVSVNMSGKSIMSEDFLKMVNTILEEEDVSPAAIEVEITETSLMEDLEKARNVVLNLHDHGIYIALDDFGTGYSSLRYLYSMPINCLKIDKSFVDGIVFEESGSRELVKGTIALAMGLGKSMVAEGVETCEQLAFLRDNGCKVIQGFLFSKPLNSYDFFLFLENSQKNILQVLNS
ncbi:MAG: bifunctional diguanylate cyclase/phosphodiesterase, partial [Desulfovibrio sp.]|nr:bifunctional diguanylate cyclase/phosphodiesterase [Desulfovibrio sp.]